MGIDVPAIVCDGLTKDYGVGRGVFDLDLQVRQGEVFGFIGPNGAGKTTTIRLLMDLIRPDRGTVRVLGRDAHGDSLGLKRHLGYLPGELVRFPGVTVAHVVGLLAGLRGGVSEDRIRELADRLSLDLSRRYEDLSHGNRQKVGLVQAFMHDPRLLILDEPTLGLDPLLQREFRRLVAEAVVGGATVFLSSHVLSEVESICDRIGLLRDGTLRRVGTLDELRALRVHRVEAILTEPIDVAAVSGLAGVSEVEQDGDRLRCAVRGPVRPLLEVLCRAGVVELDSHELSLEEVFLGEFAPSVVTGAGR